MPFKSRYRALKSEPALSTALPPYAYHYCVCGHLGKDHERLMYECRLCGFAPCFEFEAR